MQERLSSAVKVAATALSLVLIGAPADADQYRPPKGLQVSAYTFDVALSDASDTIRVKEGVDVLFSEAGVPSLTLDLCNVVAKAPQDASEPCQAPRPPRSSAAEPVQSSLGKGMTVTSVVAAGRPLKYEHRDNRLQIFLPRPSRSGERISVEIAYGGVPADGLLIGRSQAGERVFFTDNWPNKGRNWMATIDHVSAKATKTVSVVAPSSYQVVSNGLLTRQIDLPGKLRSTTWKEGVPIPPWQFALGVAPMAVHDLGSAQGVETSAWLSPDTKVTDLGAIAAETRSVMDFYSERIGPYAYEKLAHVEATGSVGAMEMASSIFYHGGGFGALPHEVAHHWFGNSVTERDWDHVWLSEGFATYMALLHTEHTKGGDAFLAGVRRTRDGAVKYALDHPTDTIIHPKEVTDSRVLYNAPQVYSGGAMVLHTLRGVLGDDRFWAALRLYYQRHHNGSATTDDFRRAAEDACKDAGDCPAELADLSWFFDQWLRRGGVPQVKGDWRYDAANHAVVLDLAQSQTQGVYRIPLTVVLDLGPEGSGSEKRSQVVVDGPRSTLSIPADRRPIDVRLDPDLRVPLMQADFRKQASSVPEERERRPSRSF